jgi:putrescine transport system permease protein
MMRRLSAFNLVSLTLGFAFLYLPILILVLYSFNAGRSVAVWGGWSTKWYASVFENDQLLDAAWVTLQVGVVSATVATILGTMAAITLARYGRFFGRTLFSAMVYAPLVMPEVITGLSLLLLFVAINLDRGFWTIVLSHSQCVLWPSSYSHDLRVLTARLKKRRWISVVRPLKHFFA